MIRSVKIGPHVYKVLSEDRDGDDFGSTDVRRCEIRVSSKQSPSQSRETLLHETLHALLTVTGLASELGDDMEEKVATRLAPALLDSLRRTPALVAFLVDG